MRTHKYVAGLGVVPIGAAAVAPVRLDRRIRFVPSREALEVLADLGARGFEGCDLVRRLRRRAGVLRACEPRLAAELERCASNIAPNYYAGAAE